MPGPTSHSDTEEEETLDPDTTLLTTQEEDETCALSHHLSAVEISTSLCLYSNPFTFYLTVLLLSLHSELFLVAKTGLGLYWTMPSTFYRYHQPLIGLSGDKSIWLDIGLGPGI